MGQTDRSRSKSANHKDRKSPYRSQRSLSATDNNEKTEKMAVPN
jgi:hypothetical protein